MCSPVIDKPRDISKSSCINDIMGLSFNQSTHIINMIINVIEITAVFFAVSGIYIGQVSKREKTSIN